MKKEYVMCVIGAIGTSAIGTAIAGNFYGTLAGFGVGCIISVIYLIDN